MRKLCSLLLLLLVLAIFAIFLLWPIWQVVRVAFVGVPTQGEQTGFTLGYFKAIFLDADLRRGLLNSAAIAVGVTVLCTLISLPLAMLSVRCDFRRKSALTSL